MGALLDIVASITVDYLSGQIEAGVDAVQLFDSWAGSLSPTQFEQLVIARTAWIVDQLKLMGTFSLAGSGPEAYRVAVPVVEMRPGPWTEEGLTATSSTPQRRAAANAASSPSCLERS